MASLTESSTKKRKFDEIGDSQGMEDDPLTLDVLLSDLKGSTFPSAADFFQKENENDDPVVKLIRLNHGIKKADKTLTSTFRVCNKRGISVAARNASNGTITAVTINEKNYKGPLLPALAMSQHLSNVYPESLRLADGYLLLAAAARDDDHIFTTGSVTKYKRTDAASQFADASVSFITKQRVNTSEIQAFSHAVTSVVLPLSASGKPLNDDQSSVAEFLQSEPSLDSYEALNGNCRLGNLGSVTSFVYAHLLKTLSQNEKIDHLWRLPFSARTVVAHQLQVMNPPMGAQRARKLFSNQAGEELVVKKLSECSEADFVITTNKAAAINQIKDFSRQEPSVQVSGENTPVYERVTKAKSQTEYRVVEVVRESAATLQAIRNALTKETRDGQTANKKSNDQAPQPVEAEEVEMF